MNFSNLNLILNILKRIKNMTFIANLFSKLETAKDEVTYMSKEPRFSTPFHSQYVKGSQKLLKSPRKHVYHISSSLL